jgi:acyl-coenzyme A synthetase/AMP-(fatty) acid ligase
VVEIDGQDRLVLVYEGAADLSRRTLAKVLPLETLPERIERVASLPRLASGKIDRGAVRDLVLGKS